MSVNRILIAAICFILLICKPALSKHDSSGINKVLNFPSPFFNKIDQTTTMRKALLTKQTERYLQQLARRE
jgi:hypothetical protein